MFHSAWMYRAREVRSRNEANQQESTTKRKAASAVQGSMSSGDCINESSGEDSSRLGSQSHDPAARSEISSEWSAAVSSRSEKIVEVNQDNSLREENHPESREAAQRTILENSSHFAVLAVNDISGDPGGVTKENGHPRDNGRSSDLLSQTEANSHVTISRQQLENSSILEESQDLNNSSVNASDMGNTHWSHSYTGVRQPVSMRASCRSDSAKLSEDLNEVYVPIIGYEMMEQRAKFTVFKLHVQKNANESWFIFRRFTDFERLNSQLAYLFPNFRLALPPKKWFGNNFDPMFLEDRQLGLQAFLNNICGHKDIVISDCVREFLCVDDPPGPHDSLEESRALCESLEETVYNLKREVAERDRKIVTLTEELSNATRRIESLTMQQMIPNDRVLPVSPNGSDSTDMDRQSCAEADQQDYSPEQEEQPIVPSFSDDKGEPAIETTKEESPPVFTSIPLDKSASDTKDAPIISHRRSYRSHDSWGRVHDALLSHLLALPDT